MVNCICCQSLTLTPQLCSSYQKLLQKASYITQQPSENIKLVYEGPNGSTSIQSDSDLLALKYTLRNNTVQLTIQISKSKQQIMNETISECVDEYLSTTYDSVAAAEEERYINSEIENYLNSLYKKMVRREEKERVKKIQKEEVGTYMNRITQEIVGRKISMRIPVRERRQMVRISPEKELFRRKESHIETMVGKILESMMPVMVKELSYRIVEELKRDSSSNVNISEYMECDLNPEQY